MTNSLLQEIPTGCCFFEGKWQKPTANRTFPIYDPANREIIAETADCGAAETELAINAAERAFQSWSAKEAMFRTKILRRWKELILENQEELAEIITLESGKPLKESMGEVLYGAGFVDWFSEEGLRVYGDTIPSPSSDKRTVVIKQPVGVAAAITPWNFPVAMVTRKVAPALAAGCTTIIKPAEDTPLSALALALLAEKAGFPSGTINVITSASPIDVGRSLTESKTVRKLSFTGSTEVGKHLMAQCAETLKRLSFELGGNAPFIVLDDADIPKAVEGAIASKFRNCGQTCVCANRFFIHSKIYDEFSEKLVEAVEQLTVGPGLENEDLGPMINGAAVEKVQSLLNSSVSDGAKVRTGGSNHSLGGNFFQPTVLCNVNQNSSVVKEEIFGPVAPLIPFETDDEVIRLANQTDSGLAAYFYSRDISRIWKIAEGLEYGMVGINTGLISNISAPFGGVKESGFGREGSKYGIEEYLNMKYLCFQID